MKEIKISEINGVKIGHAQDLNGGTGCTVIICEKGACGGVDVRGGAPASRETELLKSENMVEKVHAVVMSGGSAYGLDACSGVMQFLEEKGIGFDAKGSVVPIVCGVSLFDLAVGDSKARPDKAMGYEACKSAESGEDALLEGNVGAGTGAAVGKYLGTDRMMKGGLGLYAASIGNVKCAAIASVNALGDVFDTQTGEQIAGLLSEDKTKLESTISAMYDEVETERNIFNTNTTIGCIITNVNLTKVQCNKLASVTHNAFAKAIRPVHTSYDGDTIFVMSTGEVTASSEVLGVFATEVMEKAIARAVRKAKPAYGLAAQSQI